MAYGLREAVRLLGIDKRVQRTQLGRVLVRLPRTQDVTCVDMLGDWPPHAGSQVTKVCLESGGAIASVQTILEGEPAGPQAVPFEKLVRTVDHRGDPLFELSAGPSLITLMNHEKATVTLKPSGGSFATGVLLESPGSKSLSIRVTGRDVNISVP